jgi:hypothetical protein
MREKKASSGERWYSSASRVVPRVTATDVDADGAAVEGRRDAVQRGTDRRHGSPHAQVCRVLVGEVRKDTPALLRWYELINSRIAVECHDGIGAGVEDILEARPIGPRPGLVPSSDPGD